MLPNNEIFQLKNTPGEETKDRHSLRLLYLILNSISLGIIVSDIRGKIIYWNDPLLKHLDLTSDPLYANDIDLIIKHIYNNSIFEKAPEDRIEKLIQTKEKNFDGIFSFKGSKNLTLLSYPLHTQQNVYRVWIFSDITVNLSGETPDQTSKTDNIELNDQKLIFLANINRELESNLEKIIKEKNSRDVLLSVIAHDLKSPFQGLLGSFDVLSESFDELDKDEIKKYISYGKSSLHDLYSLIEKLLEWSRLVMGQIKFNQTKCNLYHEMISVINQSNAAIIKKQIRIVNNMNDDLDTLADENMINTIFRNFLSNAIKFSRRGGTVTLTSEKKYNFIIISFTDEGVGIDNETKDKLFDLAEHYSAKGTEDEEGSGLGLVLCKEMADWHNGSISFESEIGKGTTFHLTLPMLS